MRLSISYLSRLNLIIDYLKPLPEYIGIEIGIRVELVIANIRGIINGGDQIPIIFGTCAIWECFQFINIVDWYPIGKFKFFKRYFRELFIRKVLD